MGQNVEQQRKEIAMKKIAVLGTGNIAQTIAVDMKAKGHEVRLFAPSYLMYRIRLLAATREIECRGALETRQILDAVTSDIDEAVHDADYIILCTPGNRHEEYARILKGHTNKAQMLITFNGCMASLIYNRIWDGDDNSPVFVESTIPPFSARRAEAGVVCMYERHLAPVAFFPASAGNACFGKLREDLYDFPGQYADVLECGLSLVNPTVHPGPCLVNLSNIEKPDFSFYLYEHGFQPSGLKIDVLLNKERQNIGRALGYEVRALENFAGVDVIDSWEPLYAMGHGCHALTSICGPNDINYRYLTEDIPIALVCWASIGDLLGIETPIMDAVITLIGVAHEINWFENGRSARTLGLDGKTIDQIKNYVTTGKC